MTFGEIDRAVSNFPVISHPFLFLAPGCDPTIVRCTELNEPDNIVGIHAGIWGQDILDDTHFFKQQFPRLFAFAQRAWAEGSWEQEKRIDPWAIFEDKKFLEDINYFRYSLR